MTTSLERAAWTQTLKPVFLVGAARSGTTWLQAMLASHSAIYTGTETMFFMTFGGAEQFFLAPKERRIGLAEYLTKEQFYAFFSELFWTAVSALPPAPPTAQYFLEKTTDHSRHAQFILSALPDARFIHLVRDSRSVVASMLAASRGWGASWAPSSVDAAVESWRLHVETGRRIGALVPSPEQFIEVRYEDLRADTPRCLQSLFGWLGVDAAPDIAEAISRRNSLEQAQQSATPFASIAMTRSAAVQPIASTAYPAGFVGSAPASGESANLTSLQRARVEFLTWPLLKEYGYLDARPALGLLERVRMGRRVRSALKLKPL